MGLIVRDQIACLGPMTTQDCKNYGMKDKHEQKKLIQSLTLILTLT